MTRPPPPVPANSFKHRSEGSLYFPTRLCTSRAGRLVEARKNTNTLSSKLPSGTRKLSELVMCVCVCTVYSIIFLHLYFLLLSWLFFLSFFKTICNIYEKNTLSSGAWMSCGCCCSSHTATRGTWRRTWTVMCARPSGRWRSRSCRTTSRLCERSCSCWWGHAWVSDEWRPHPPISWHWVSCSHHSASPSQGRERSSPDHRRYSMLDPSALDSEVNRLRHRLLNTEDALRNALEHNQQVDQLVQAMRQRPDKSPVTCRQL